MEEDNEETEGEILTKSEKKWMKEHFLIVRIEPPSEDNAPKK